MTEADVEPISLWGEYERAVDQKGRLMIPGEWKGEAGTSLAATRGPDGSIWLFPQPNWEQLQKALPGEPDDEQAAMMQRLLRGRTLIGLDPQGRALLPKHLREWAQLGEGEPAVMLGLGRRIEVWSKATWQRYAGQFTHQSIHDAVRSLNLTELLG